MMPSVRIHVDGGFAVGASSFNRQGSPRSLSCRTTGSATAYRSPSDSPSFKPRMILRDRLSAKATAYRRTSPLVMRHILLSCVIRTYREREFKPLHLARPPTTGRQQGVIECVA